MKKMFYSIIFAFLIVGNAIGGNIYSVTNNGETGAGTLREAIQNALATNPGATPHSIIFSIGGGGTQQTIILTGVSGPLPPLNNANVNGLIIDATTQGSTASPDIILVGPGWGNGFQLDGRNNIEIRGFMIRGFAHGIYINGSATYNTIGGTVAGYGNYIGGNNEEGIYLENAGKNNKVVGNVIGLNLTGDAALPNNQNGVRVYNSDKVFIGGVADSERNIISGNGVMGIRVTESDSVYIENNYVGLDITGTNSIRNNSKGILVQNNSRYCSIGSTTLGKGNVVGGHINGEGILVEYACHYAKVLGNIVGLDKTETLLRPNKVGINLNESNYGLVDNNVACGSMQEGGILINNFCLNSIVTNNYAGTNRSLAAGLGNTEEGVYIQNANGTLVENNIIINNQRHGVGIINNALNSIIRNNTIEGNSMDGIRIHQGANNNVIGGLSGAEGNIITGNGSNAITIDGASAVNNAVRSNSIYCNGDRGIVLSNNGNNNYAAPTFTGTSTNFTITGPAGSFIEVFEIDECENCAIDLTNNKLQGKVYRSDLSGPSPLTISGVSSLTLTATASSGNTSTPHNTSEFSTCQILCIASTSNSGTDQNLCEQTSAILDGNVPGSGETGTWTQVSGPAASINSINSPSSDVTLTGGVGVYVFQWTVTGGGCADGVDEVTINNKVIPVSNTGSAQDLCNSTSALMNANVPLAGQTGIWSQVSGPSATINSVNDPAASILLNGGIGNYVFQWTVSNNGTCPDATSTVAINNQATTTVATVGADQTICASTTILSGNTPGLGTTGQWTVTSGSAIITDPSNPVSTATDFGLGENVLTWTITAPCGAPVSADLKVTIVSSTLSVETEAAQDTLCIGKEVDIVALVSGSTATPLIYTWTSTDGSLNLTNQNNSVTIIPSGIGWTTYNVSVTDAVGCTSNLPGTDSVYVTAEQTLVIPNLMTPNDDHSNDCFIIRDVNNFDIIPGSQFGVYNRWGDRVYSNNNFKNGDFCGSTLADGMYYYSIKTSCGSEEIKGWLHIISNENHLGSIK